MSTPETYDDYDDYDGPVPTDAEILHSDRMGECYDRARADGVSFDVAIVACGYCPDVVEATDCEGYPYTTRCLGPIDDPELGACEGHAAERRTWMAMSEFERAEWERRIDEEMEAGLR